MALSQIDTGYKPWGALGPVYHGFNAADSAANNEQELLKQFLANQERQYKLPNEIATSNFEGEKARTLNNPAFLAALLQGSIGEQNTKFANGEVDLGTYKGKIDSTNSGNKIKVADDTNKALFLEEQLRRLREIQGGQEPTMGFNMAPTAPPAQPSALIPGRIASQWGGEGLSVPAPVGPLKTEAAMRNSMGTDYRSGSKPYDLETIDAEIKKTGDPTGELAKERARIVAELAQGGNANPVPNVQATPGTGNIPFFNAPTDRLQQMASVLGTNPGLFGDIAKEQVKGVFDLQKGREKNSSDTAVLKDSTTRRGQTIKELNDIDGKIVEYRKMASKEYIEQQKLEAFDRIVNGSPKPLSEDEQRALKTKIASEYEEVRRKNQEILERYQRHADKLRYDLHPELAESAPAKPSSGKTIKFDAQGNRIDG